MNYAEIKGGVPSYDKIPKWSTVTFVDPDPPEWKCSVLGLYILFNKQSKVTWWVRMWTRIFFGAKWERL